MRSWPRERYSKFLLKETLPDHADATRSVVLIDEIDKAPRDFPNDILYETERLRFEIKETNWPPFEVNEQLRPVIIVTSNQERNLPEAFLRRCVFYYISAPDEKVLRSIVRRRFMPADESGAGSQTRGAEYEAKPLTGPQGELYEAALQRFRRIHEDPLLLKHPATAEMLNWMRALERKRITADEVRKDSGKLAATWGVLAKTKEDLEHLQKSPAQAATATT